MTYLALASVRHVYRKYIKEHWLYYNVTALRINHEYSPGIMTSSNGNIFRDTGPIWEESTGHGWIPLTKASDGEFWCFLWSASGQTAEQTIEMSVVWDAFVLTFCGSAPTALNTFIGLDAGEHLPIRGICIKAIFHIRSMICLFVFILVTNGFHWGLRSVSGFQVTPLNYE